MEPGVMGGDRMTDEIKPCPFCQSACVTRDAIPSWPDAKVDMEHIWCMGCDYQSPPFVVPRDADKAIAAHNRVSDAVHSPRDPMMEPGIRERRI